jgi:Protein of unknown function (DUF3703)
VPWDNVYSGLLGKLLMPSFAKAIRPYVDHEIQQAQSLWNAGQHHHAFRHLERAHVLGQSSTTQHVRTHWHMLIWGIRRKSLRESLGQIIRMIGAASKTAIGFVPKGNTGGSNISPFKSLSVPQDLAAILESVNRDARTK